MEEGNGEMKVRYYVCNRGRHNEVSVVYLLLLMVMTILGCNNRDVGGAEKKDADDTSATGETGRLSPISQRGSSQQAISRKRSGSSGAQQMAGGGKRNEFFTKIFSHDRRQYFSVFLSLVPLQKESFHLRDLLVSPYYNELFACGRVHQKEKDRRNYQAHFKVSEDHRITFDKLTAGADDMKVRTMTRNDSRVAACLLGLYRNSLVELSGTVPVTQFFLSFDFKK
jgi:hypothetical protein